MTTAKDGLFIESVNGTKGYNYIKDATIEIKKSMLSDGNMFPHSTYFF